jgi:hypothetical protein
MKFTVAEYNGVACIQLEVKIASVEVSCGGVNRGFPSGGDGGKKTGI